MVPAAEAATVAAATESAAVMTSAKSAVMSPTGMVMGRVMMTALLGSLTGAVGTVNKEYPAVAVPRATAAALRTPQQHPRHGYQQNQKHRSEDCYEVV